MHLCCASEAPVCDRVGQVRLRIREFVGRLAQSPPSPPEAEDPVLCHRCRRPLDPERAD
jgi:hypothetical protein